MLKERCSKLMAALEKEGVDGAIITHGTNIRYFSNFTSDECVLVISANRRVLMTDFRYTIQATPTRTDVSRPLPVGTVTRRRHLPRAHHTEERIKD